jgi:hypothetical protein
MRIPGICRGFRPETTEAFQGQLRYVSDQCATAWCLFGTIFLAQFRNVLLGYSQVKFAARFPDSPGSICPSPLKKGTLRVSKAAVPELISRWSGDESRSVPEAS